MVGDYYGDDVAGALAAGSPARCCSTAAGGDRSRSGRSRRAPVIGSLDELPALLGLR